MKIVEGFRMRHILGQYAVVGEGAAQVDFNKLVTLNATAAYLWQEVEGKEFDVSVLAELIVNKYGIDSNTALADAQLLVQKWTQLGLVK